MLGTLTLIYVAVGLLVMAGHWAYATYLGNRPHWVELVASGFYWPLFIAVIIMDAVEQNKP